MYMLQVLNSASEWELIVHKFNSKAQAVAFYNAELACFEDYEVVKIA